MITKETKRTNDSLLRDFKKHFAITLLLGLLFTVFSFVQTDFYRTRATNNNWSVPINGSTTNLSTRVTTVASVANGAVDVHFNVDNFPDARDYILTVNIAANCKDFFLKEQVLLI